MGGAVRTAASGVGYAIAKSGGLMGSHSDIGPRVSKIHRRDAEIAEKDIFALCAKRPIFPSQRLCASAVNLTGGRMSQG
jgi:hypothetical protein